MVAVPRVAAVLARLRMERIFTPRTETVEKAGWMVEPLAVMAVSRAVGLVGFHLLPSRLHCTFTVQEKLVVISGPGIGQ